MYGVNLYGLMILVKLPWDKFVFFATEMSNEASSTVFDTSCPWLNFILSVKAHYAVSTKQASSIVYFDILVDDVNS